MVDFYEQLSKERKDAQAKGLYPEYFTTGGYQMFKEGYLYEAEGFKDQLRRVVQTLAKHAKSFLPEDHPYHKRITENLGKTWEEAFFTIFWKGYAGQSSPMLANTGTDRGCNVSCSGATVANDIQGFGEGLAEMMLLNKEGFGTSSYLGNVQSRGSLTGRGFKANGTYPLLKLYQEAAGFISQGSVRRGAWAGYLPMEHGDFPEWCNGLIKNPKGQNIGWNIGDQFIEDLKNNKKIAHDRFDQSLYAKILTGKGYFWKVDHVNRAQPKMYKDLGLSNKASNLCVAPETTVLTKKGHVPIIDLVGQEVDVWNGEEWSKVTPRKTGEDQKLFKVTTRSGQTLDSTEYHKWYVVEDYGKSPVEKRTWELKEGDKLVKFDLPILKGEDVLPCAYDNGFFTGDGYTFKGSSYIYLYHEKRNLEEKLPSVKRFSDQPKYKRKVGRAVGLKDKYFVPGSTYTLDSRLRWLAGFLDADGCIYRNGTNEAITASSSNLEFILEVQEMLQTLGIHSKVRELAKEGYKLLPKNDGSGEVGEYYCKTSYRLLISSAESFKLLSMGLKLHRLEIKLRKPQRDAKGFNTVISVEDLGRVDDTYCLTEPKRNTAVFNGILTGNCTEITLHSDEDHTYTCVIFSMNLLKYLDFKDTGAMFTARVLLDCMCEEFIQKGSKIPGLEKAVRSTIKSRAVGLGAMGWHSYLQKQRIPLSHFQAHMENMEIFGQMEDECEAASKWMAEVWGEPEWCRGYGVRGTHNTAIAPNMSSAVLCGQVSQGIEPWYANIFYQPTAAGEMLRINPFFLELLQEKGITLTKKLKNDIIAHKGSVQHLNFFTLEEKLLLRTAFEEDQRTLLRLASTRQQFIDQGQSLNLFFAAGEDAKYISEIHKELLLDDRLKGAYYMRTQAGVQAAKEECLSCQ